MSSSVSSERFYLSKGGSSDVYICEEFAERIKPFQRDGIRFLYRQFVKKKPGVILNDPPSCGKTVQAVLFLNALRLVLRPLASLVVCSEDKLPHWRAHFQLWTDCAEDILGNTNSIFSKKDIFISSIDSIASAIRWDWGIVVADGLNTGKHLKQLKLLNAKFKIWSTVENVVENLQTLSAIHGWIDPKEKFDLKAYDSTGLSGKERVEKDIALSIFCEDLLIRRTNVELSQVDEKNYNSDYILKNKKSENYQKKKPSLNSPFRTSIKQDAHTLHDESRKVNDIQLNTSEKSPVITEVKRKNKDSTGLKIKRTKKPSEATENPENSNQIVEAYDINEPNILSSNKIINKKSKLFHKTDENADTGDTSNDAIQNDVGTNNAVLSENIPEKCIKTSINNKVLHEYHDKPIKCEIETVTEEETVLKDMSLKNNAILKSITCIDAAVVAKNAHETSTDIKYISKEDANFTLSDILFPNSKEIEVKAKFETKAKYVPVPKCNEGKVSSVSNDIKNAVKKIEELTTKQFMGSLLDSLF